MKYIISITLFSALFFGVIFFGSCKKNNNDTPSNSKNYILKKHLIQTELPCFVNIMFEVKDASGMGVSDLVTSDFEVLEDGKAVSPTESAMTVKNKDGISYNIKTVLLLDNSASVGSNLNEIKNAATNLVSKIVDQQEVAIYVFSEEAVLVQDFTNDITLLTNAINSISLGYATTNLYGSIETSVTRWDDFYSTQSIEQGYMIAITDGSDTQGSSTLQEALDAIGDKNVFTIGLGSEQDQYALKQLGTAGYYSLENYSELSDKFAEIQDEIISYANSFYFLYYMSPKRGDNVHSLKLMVKENINSTQFSYILDEFNSNGFYSVQQGVVVNNGISNLDLYPGGTNFLTAITYLPVNNPSYSWSSSNDDIVRITPEPGDNSQATIIATGVIGESAIITVTDLSNNLNTTIEVEIVENPYGEFVDSRDNQVYLTIDIGNQEWMAENLNYTTEVNSWVYNDSEVLSETFGRLYTWEKANIACPDGWHLPSHDEWLILINHLGGPEIAGGKLKETGPLNWKSPNSFATNESNFSARPGGLRYTDDSYFNISENAYYWTSTATGLEKAYYRKLDYDRGSISYGSNDKQIGFSVRCVKD